MQKVLRATEEAAREIGHVDLFCDYDGVLTPIAPRPQDAFLEEGTLDLLRLSSRHPAFHMTVVSGRSLADIQQRVRVPGITHVGNHGLEIEGPDLRRVECISPSALHAMRALAESLGNAMQQFPGVIVEDKVLVVAVHFRLADPMQIPAILQQFSRLVADHNRDNVLRVTGGKHLIEARPTVQWDKGRAVRFLLEARHGVDWEKHALPVYLGDDETDEDAFLTLGGSGITIRIGHPGKRPTAARFTLRDTRAVRTFLDSLLHSLP